MNGLEGMNIERPVLNHYLRRIRIHLQIFSNPTNEFATYVSEQALKILFAAGISSGGLYLPEDNKGSARLKLASNSVGKVRA